MATFRQARNALLLAHDAELIDAEEFILLYDLNRSKNLDFPYQNYDPFNLDDLSDDECWTEFRFFKADIHRLAEALQVPERITCYNRSVFNGFEAFCALLKRFAYPIRYGDMIKRFGRPVSELCMMTNHMMNIIYDGHSHLLTELNQAWLAPAQLYNFSQVIQNKGAALQNCWGFIDGTVRPICRPTHNQRLVYNGHKRVHSLKYQSVVAPNGLIANLFGPIEGCRHDSGMLRESNLLNLLERYSHDHNGNILCLYGDPAYPLREHLQAPFRGNLTPMQEDFNKSMSRVRISVEWVFGEICTYFAFVDFKKNLKMELSPVGKMYKICALLTNARTCLYKSKTSMFFDIDPPILEYLLFCIKSKLVNKIVKYAFYILKINALFFIPS